MSILSELRPGDIVVVLHNKVPLKSDVVVNVSTTIQLNDGKRFLLSGHGVDDVSLSIKPVSQEYLTSLGRKELLLQVSAKLNYLSYNNGRYLKVKTNEQLKRILEVLSD